MKIECYISHGCSSLVQLKANIEQALKEGGIEANAYYYRISDEKAAELKLSGSPSVFIDGKELQPQGIAGFS